MTPKTPIQKTAGLHLESDRNPAMDTAMNTLQGLGTGVAVPAGALWAGSHLAQKSLPKYELVDPNILEHAEAFSNLEKNPGSSPEFVRNYVHHGSDLTRKPAVQLPSGERLSGAAFMNKVRGEGLTSRLSEMLTGSKYTPESRHHYQRFSEGVIPAYLQLNEELFEKGVMVPRYNSPQHPHVFGGHEGLKSFYDTTLGEARYQAARELADAGQLDPRAFRQKLVDVMQDKARGIDRAELETFVQNLEERLRTANPEKYQQHLKTIRSGADATALQNELFHSAGVNVEGRNADILLNKLNAIAKEQGIVGDVQKLAPETQKLLLDKLFQSKDPVVDLLNIRMRQSWHGAPGLYNNSIKPLLKYHAAHKDISKGISRLGRAGKIGLIAGGTAAAIPIAAHLLRKPESYNVKFSAEQHEETTMPFHLKHAYYLGAQAAHINFEKIALSTANAKMLKDMAYRGSLGSIAGFGGGALVGAGAGKDRPGVFHTAGIGTALGALGGAGSALPFKQLAAALKRQPALEKAIAKEIPEAPAAPGNTAIAKAIEKIKNLFKKQPAAAPLTKELAGERHARYLATNTPYTNQMHLFPPEYRRPVPPPTVDEITRQLENELTLLKKDDVVLPKPLKNQLELFSGQPKLPHIQKKGPKGEQLTLIPNEIKNTVETAPPVLPHPPTPQAASLPKGPAQLSLFPEGPRRVKINLGKSKTTKQPPQGA